MDFGEIVLKNRSYRRYYEDHTIDYETVKTLINYARLAASSGNIQGLKYIISCKNETNTIVFNHLKWAF